ncbi:MAG: ATP synthase F1 subunit gamma [Candidatus Omnitrophica bacterium]|nr:ATP synthase F1 subunit gamma [Candidatus Omnitrophota bacterium]
MSQSIKQIKNRIRSVENSKKVTSAMQMISVAKLNRIQNKLFSMRPYALELEHLMYNLASLSPDLSLEYFKKDTVRDSVLLCVITSDSGLCGVYNQNIIHAAEEFIGSNGPERVSLVLVGQKGLNYFRKRGVKIINSYIGLNAKFSQAVCDKITTQLMQLFLTGQASSVYLAYTSFENSIIQKAVIEQLLSIEPKNLKPVEYIAEPDLKSILAGLIPKYLMAKMQLVFLEAFTSEHAARTVAMKTATDNAKELLEGLVLLRNKVRQAGITQDILEITSSVEALREG